MGKGKRLRKGLAMLLAVVMIIGFLPGIGSLEVSAEEGSTSEATITPSEPEGDGTKANPYQIGTAAELYWFARLVNGTLEGVDKNTSAHAVLTKNIVVNTGVLDANGDLVEDTDKFIKWTPISTIDYPFQGTFNGQNHTISGLYFKNAEADDVGLFGYSESGNILNVGIIDSYFEGNGHVGSICGTSAAAVIKYCYNTGKVSGAYCVGGVCGYSMIGDIQYCYNTNTVEGVNANVGGVCGLNDQEGTIKNSYNTGAVKGLSYVGGVCGRNDYYGTIENSYNTGAVTGTDLYLGGICGQNRDNATIKNSYNTGAVKGLSYVGGICGFNFDYGTIENSYNTGTCYNTDTSAGSELYIGGVCAMNYGIIKKCYYNNSAYTGRGIGADSENATSEDVSGKTTDEMNDAKFCNDFIKYHSYQNGICALCDTYQPAELTTDKYDLNGDDKNEDVYEISNAGQLYWFAKLVNGTLSDVKQNTSANAVLTNNITVNTGVLDANGNLASDTDGFTKWTPIGDGYDNIFEGTFDGQNYTINGLYFENTETGYVGLFGMIEAKGKVVNAGIRDSYLKGKNGASGIGQYNSGLIENCYYTGIVNGSQYVGGICENNSGTIKNCYYMGTVVSSSKIAGGICGVNAGTIQNCYHTGKVSGSDKVGGICGSADDGTIDNCYHTGDVSGSGNVGGVCGTNPSGIITNCYYDSDVYDGIAIGKTSSGKDTEVKGKTTEQFKNGEVAYLLQKGQKDQTKLVWGQKLGEDIYPVLGGSAVYKNATYNGCEGKPGEPESYFYSNTEGNIYTPHKDDGTQGGTAYDNICDVCGKAAHHFVNGVCDVESCGYKEGEIINNSYMTKIAYRGDSTNAKPEVSDFTVNSEQEPTFTWYQGDVTEAALSEKSESILKSCPKEVGIYTLVVHVDGVKQEDGTVYTAAELRVLVTIAKEELAGTMSLNGTAKYGETLKAIIEEITNKDSGAISYQWYRVDGEKVTAIAGATGNCYTLTVEDVDKKIKVEVSADYCEGNLSATTESVVSRLDGSAELTSASAQLSKSWDGTTIVTPSFTTINETGTNNENVIFEYKKITDTDYTTTAPTDAGTYHVRVKVKADSIHKEAVSEPVEFTIAKVDATVVVAPVAAANLILEQGKTVTLIDASNASVTGGQLQYALSEAGTYSAALPTVTEAGTYSVYYKVVGDQNHNDTKPVKIDVTVSKKIEEKKDSTATQPTEGSTVSQPPKNGDVIADEKTKAKFEVTDVSKKEVTYNAPTDNKAKDITVPDTVTINGEVYKVTKIDDNAFKGNKAVTNITIGSNVKTIGKNAFSGCKKLKTIIIKSKTLTDKKISKKAFKGISKKTVIKVPKKKLAAYKKLLKKKGLSSKNKVKGY